MMAVQKVIIDTDPGIDDAMAILFACLHGGIDLIGLTTIFGNVTTGIATRNALALGELAGKDIPVARGADRPLKQPQKPVAVDVHGREGFGDVPPFSPRRQPDERSAAHFICDEVGANPGEVILCPIGPLTNLALALQRDPSIAEMVKSVTIMGGSISHKGNVTAHAEANMWQDPHAADIVLAAPWKINLVGLNVTERVVCTPDDFAAVAEAAPILGGFLNRAVQFYFDFHRKNDGIDGCHMHDPSAVISIVRPDLFKYRRERVEVRLDGPDAGKTIIASDGRRPPVSACTGIDIDGVRNAFLSTLKAGF